MVLVIAFLTVTNIALGYGLAIYIDRHFGTLLLSRSKSTVTPQQEVADSPLVAQLAEELPTLAPKAVRAVVKQAVVEAPPTAAKAPAAETAASEPVEEENVLAGIEEFRSQLAKMNTAVEQPPEATPAKAAELAATAN
jgi:hypothetical protein